MKSGCVLQNDSYGIWVILNPFDRSRPPLISVFLKQLLPMLEMVVFVSGFVRRRLLQSSHAKFPIETIRSLVPRPISAK